MSSPLTSTLYWIETSEATWRPTLQAQDYASAMLSMKCGLAARGLRRRLLSEALDARSVLGLTDAILEIQRELGD